MGVHPRAVSASVPHEHRPFPTIRYRRGADGEVEATRCETADEVALLGPEWVDSPAKVDEPAQGEPAQAPVVSAEKPKGKNGKKASKASKAEESADDNAGDDTGDVAGEQAGE